MRLTHPVCVELHDLKDNPRSILVDVFKNRNTNFQTWLSAVHYHQRIDRNFHFIRTTLDINGLKLDEILSESQLTLIRLSGNPRAPRI